MIAARRLQEGAKTFPYVKVTIVVVGLLYAYVAAVSVSQAQGDLGAIGWPKILGFSLAPICLFFAFRYPVVFPFGLYIALSPFDPLFSVSGTASLVRIIGFAVLAAMALRMLRLRRVFIPQRAWYYWLALLVYATFTLLWTVNFDDGLKTIYSVAMLFVMMTLLATYPVTLREFQIIVSLLVVSSIGAGIVCVHEFASGSVSNEVAPRLDLSQNGFSIDVNYLAGSFIGPLAFALAGVFYVKNIWVKLVCAFAVLSYLGGIFVNGSRESLLAAAVVMVFFIVRSKHRIVALGFGALSLSSIAFFPSIVNRLFQSNIADGSGRTDIWRVGMHTFGDHWLLGAGLAAFPVVYDQNVLLAGMKEFPGWHRPGHSMIFESLTDFGVLGTLLYVACWYVSFRQLSIIPKTSALYGIRVACEGSIIGFAVVALFIDPFYVKYIWFAHSIALMALNLYNPRMIGLGTLPAAAKPRLQRAAAYRGG